MTVKSLIAALTQQEDINFLLTNRVPRAALTRFMGWFSKIEQPVVRDLSIACWRLFSDLDLSEARKTDFKSLHDCFTRELKPGLRPPDPDPKVVVSPCDAIIGAFGAIADTELFQVKGAPYSLADLIGDPALVEAHRNGRFITLRLTSSMYHRFHAPCGLPDRAGRFHQRRHLERQSDRAEADRKTVLQERTRGDQDPSRHRRGADAGAGRGHSGRQHPAAFSRSPAQRRHARGRSSSPATSASARARNSAGSSTARPSSCSRRRILNSATMSWQPRGSVPASRCLRKRA